MASLECAAAPSFAFVSAPIDTPTLSPFPILPLAHSLRVNAIGAEGATALAAILNETKITNLKCAAPAKRLLLCQRPLTHLRTLPPPLHVLYLRQKRAHLLAWSLSESSSQLLHHIPHSLAMLPSIVRRVDRGHVLLSDRWFSAPVYSPHPLASQLAAQRPRRPG